MAGLFREYADSLGFSLDFQDFDEELRSMPGEYAPPRGALFLARVEGQVAGCAGLRPIGPDICEMKRLYVRPAFRGHGLGRELATLLVARARARGYRRMRLDTVPTMNAAIRMYRSMGFVEIPPYRYNPIKGALFFELVLE